MVRQHAIRLFFLFFFFLVSSVHTQQQVNVDAEVRVQSTRFIYRPFTRIYEAVVTIPNISHATSHLPLARYSAQRTTNEIRP